MSTSTQLRRNINQHVIKNLESRKDDKKIFLSMKEVAKYLENRFAPIKGFDKYKIEICKNISFNKIINFIKESKIRKNFNFNFNERTIKPDGGLLILKKINDTNFQKILLIAETKRQGTNDIRKKEGKKKQATGNAIERLGKNLIGIRTMFNHELITPFVCFCSGCDFDSKEGYVASKMCMMNEFYKLNKIYVWKRDGSTSVNRFAPVSMYFKKEEWKTDEMTTIMKEIAETSLRYYLF